MHQKVLSMILVLVMLLGLLSVSAFTVADTTSSDSADSTEFMRIFHLDCGRKYFSVSEIEGIIDQLAANHYTHLQLAFGNDGLRFLLNDMSVTVNGTKHASDDVTSAIKQGNQKLTSGSSGELSESNMDDIISYANDKGIQIIPMFNAPGHMYTAVNAMSTLGINGANIKVSTLSDGRTSNWAVDPTDSTAVEFAEELLQKYVTYFAQKGSTMFNIGADESGLSEENYASYAAMVNGMNTIVKRSGMTTLAYNDGIYNANYATSQSNVTFDNDIVICYWTEDNSASVADFLSKGFKILNNNNAWYYVLGDYLYRAWNGTDQWSYKSASSGVQNTPVTKMMGYTGTKQPIGSILCVWCDGPSVNYTDGYGYITRNQTNQQCVYSLIKAMADANPEYFTDEVKLPATDTSEDVSVEVVGKKDEKASVTAEKIDSSDYSFDAEKVEKVVSYNVTPKVEGKDYTGKGTVTLPVPSDWVRDASRIRAYIIDNGTVKVISGELSSDGKYTFVVPHFSEMGLLQVAESMGNSVDVTVGQDRTSQAYTLSGDNLPANGEYKTADGIASYTIATTEAGKTAEKAGQIESGKTYIIGNGKQYLMLNGSSIGTTDNPAEATEWTIRSANGGYTVQSGNYYLYGGRGSLSASTYNSTTWSWSTSDGFNMTSRGTRYYLTYSSGWTLSSSAKGGSQPYTTASVPGETTVKFKGLKPGSASVTLGDITYNITVTEKQTVEIPISIVDYRADGLLFDFQVGGNTYDYGLVHTSNETGSVSSNGGTLDGTKYGTKISGTTLENTGYVANDTWSGVYYNWGNKWSRSGMVESKLGSNGMPVYTNATVARVAQELAEGKYNSAEMAKVANSNDVIYNTFIASGKVVGTDATKMSDAFSARKSWDNITNAYDLAWYLLNTLYQADTNMTTVTDANGMSHTVPIYGMAVNTYDRIILTENNGVYSFDAANGKSHYDTTSRSIYEDDSVNTLQFYPIDGLGYDAILGDTTDKTDTPYTKDGNGNTTTVRPEHPNGSYTLRGEAQFVYQDDLYFEFSGDDDVYMYINGILALDLGGAHGICTKRVNLKDVAEKCKLTPGDVATFTFFYMERNSDASNFKIETNMELVKPGISVAKKAYDSGYVNEIPSGAAVETGKSVFYDLIVTNQSNVAMSKISFADKDSLDGTAKFGFDVGNASVAAGAKNANGIVSLQDSGSYVIYVTDANGAEASGTRQTLTSLAGLSEAVAGVTLQPGQSLHVRFLSAKFDVEKAKILDYENVVNVKARVGNQNLSASATHELYSYNAGDTSRTYVVDFGLPLQIKDIFDAGVAGKVSDVKISNTNTQKYGTVELSPDGYNTSLVYTRTADKTINDAETIVLDVTYQMGSNKVTLQKTLTIIPATSVYYEDSLATFNDGTGAASGAQWSIVGDNDTATTDQSATMNQALSALGEKKIYGYDTAYENSTKLSMGSAHKVTVKSDMYVKGDTTTTWPTATFTFKGTGFDVISLTDNNSGAISVKVYSVGSDGTETQVKGKLVNNYYGYTYKDGKWTATPTETNNALYQIPVIKIDDLTYGTYKVVITASYASYADKTGDGQYSFWLDAIRVYNPMDKDNATYAQDEEGYPQYIKLRDSLAKDSTATADAVFIDGAEKADVALYTNYGPNNEVYLANGQAITFNVPVNANIVSVQIGAKAPDGQAAKMVVNGKETDIASATEMYYKIAQAGGNFTITNTGTGVLSLTNLKITFTASGNTVTLTPPTAEEQNAAVMSVRALFAAPAEPFQPDRFEASWGHAVRKGDTATLTVKTSEDVESITVDGQKITTYDTKTERTGWGWWAKTVTYREFTYTDTAVETKKYTVCAVNSDGVSSDPITATLTVRPSVRDWWHGIFDKWF